VTKRAVDVVVAAVGLVVTGPLMALVALAVRLRMGRPVLFRQTRPGLHAAPFTIYKFRTMVDGSGSDEVRITPLGRRLRATSLDELPSLWNVLRGEMSLVGPRPLLVEYLDRYSPEQARRHDVRPGITGPAQVADRDAVSWADRMARDVWYVDHHSLRVDLWVLARTVAVVVRRMGVRRPSHVHQ
jgi:lipopolysaccharide/colanic/teichoic acid biosynthesis glycosyltransferase